MMYKPYCVSLLEPTPHFLIRTPEVVCDPQPPGKAEGALASEVSQESSNKPVAQMAQGATTTNSMHASIMRSQVPSSQIQHPASMQGPYSRQPMQQPNPTQMPHQFVHHHAPGGTQGMVPSNIAAHPTGMETQQQPFQAANMRKKLQETQAMQQGRYPQSAAQPPPMYPGHTVSQMPRPPGGYAMPQRVMTKEMLAKMNPQQQRAYYLQRQRIRQQQYIICKYYMHA